MASSARHGAKVYSLVEGSDQNGHDIASVPSPEQKTFVCSPWATRGDPGRAATGACGVTDHGSSGDTGVMTQHPDREKQTYATVDDYLAAATYDIEPRLAEMRRVIRQTLPHAEEKISYNIPAYVQHGVVVVQFAGYTEHTSLNFFPTAGAFATFDEELKAYRTSKSAIRFPLDEPLPVDLISRIAEFRLAEAAEFAARKKSGR